MSILSGFLKTKKYRKTASGYKLQSEWTSSQTVQMDDGNTLQNNLGAIKGITSSLTSTSSSYALSAAAGKNLQDQLTVKTYTVTPATDKVNNYKEGDIKAFSYGKIGIVTGTISPKVTGSDLVLVTFKDMTPAYYTAGVGSSFSATDVQTSCGIGIRPNSSTGGTLSFTLDPKGCRSYRFCCVFPIK